MVVYPRVGIYTKWSRHKQNKRKKKGGSWKLSLVEEEVSKEEKRDKHISKKSGIGTYHNILCDCRIDRW